MKLHIRKLRFRAKVFEPSFVPVERLGCKGYFGVYRAVGLKRLRMVEGFRAEGFRVLGFYGLGV